MNETQLPPTHEQQDSKVEQRPVTSAAKKGGFVKVLGLTAIIMAVALPIGVYPRVLQSMELEHTQKGLDEHVPEVSTVHPTAIGATRTVSLPGTIEPILETAIHARVDGYVKKRIADIGDTVHAGQVLAELETPDVDESDNETRALVLTNVANKAQVKANYDKAKADLDTAISDLAQAKASLIEKQSAEKFAATSSARWEILAKQGAVSFQDADEKATNLKTSAASRKAAEDKVHSTESQVTAAKAKLDAELANLSASDANVNAAQARERRTSTQQSFKNVVAPFAGVITERNIDPGSLITSGSENSKQALYRLARIDTVKVFIDVPQYASSGIRVGQTVTATLKEQPGKTFTGRVDRTSVALDPNSRTLRTEIHIPNTGMQLAPGMYADVSFTVPRAGHSVVIPVNALINRAEGPQVAVVNGTTVEYKSVTLGDDLGKQIEIVSGLSSKDSVIINPSDSLKAKSQVVIAQATK